MHDSCDDACEAAVETIDRHLLFHELRTPLCSVLGAVHMLRAGEAAQLSEPAAEWLSQIELAGTHMLHVLDLFGPPAWRDAAHGRLRAEQADLVAALGDSLRLLRLPAQLAGVALSLKLGGHGAVMARGSVSALRQVFINLVSNAVKYTPRGGRVEVELEADDPGQGCELCVAVRDNGLGMSARQMARLFEPYQRLGRERGGAAGSGLGLYATRLIVDALGARLAVESVEGQGTCVRVCLDIVAADPA